MTSINRTDIIYTYTGTHTRLMDMENYDYSDDYHEGKVLSTRCYYYREAIQY